MFHDPPSDNGLFVPVPARGFRIQLGLADSPVQVAVWCYVGIVHSAYFLGVYCGVVWLAIFLLWPSIRTLRRFYLGTVVVLCRRLSAGPTQRISFDRRAIYAAFVSGQHQTAAVL